MIRATAAAALLALLVSTGAVAEPPMSGLQRWELARAEVLDRVRAAAGAGVVASAEDGPGDESASEPSPGRQSSQVVPGASEPGASDPVVAELAPERETALRSQELGLSAVFSGHDLDAPVTLTMGEPVVSVMRRSLVAEAPGVMVSDVVDITATDADGNLVTSFPAELVEVSDGAEPGPTVVDVIPGIALEFGVDPERVEASGVDPSTLRILTREGPGGEWAELPSYFDAGTGTVKGESDHLSQFVVIGIPFVASPGPRVVLDPDNDEGSVSTPAPASEFPYNWQLVSGLASMLAERCLAQVVVTRPAGVPFVSRATRAGVAAAANPVATVGFGFNTWLGFGWGSESEGGTHVFSRGGAADDALRSSFLSHMPAYTGRPAQAMSSTAWFPFDDYAGLPGAYAHVEALFLDHNYDRPVIDYGFGTIVDGAFRSLGGYLESIGFDCTDPATGGWPSPPSAADLAKWKHLGYQNYQTYGADPVSFSTGNLVESFPLFALPGLGDQIIDATLVYNAQDGRLSRVGAGWSFGLGARAQRFDDGSVLTVRGDGASFVFTPDGAGGYDAEPGTGLTLAEAGAGLLRLTDADGSTWVFDAADVEGIGELSSYTDPQGRELTFTYGGADPEVHQFVPLTAVTDAAGQQVTVSGDEVGRITGFVLPDGRTWQLAYDSAGNLVSITDADGGVRSFTYDGEHRMLTATDPEGVTYLVNEYDDAGRVVAQWDAEGNERTFSYGAGETVYTDNEGGRWVFAFDEGFRITGIQNPAGDTASWTFDARGNVTSHTDEAGRTTRYEYDGRDDLVAQTDPLGNTTRFVYTAGGRVAKVTDPLGRVTTYSYDDRDLVTRVDRADGTAQRFTYTPAGDLATAVAPSGATTSYGYDDRGNLTSLTDPLGRTTAYAYDLSNRLVSVTDPEGGVTAYTWDAADRLVQATDPVGGVTVFGYDRNGNLTTATDPMGAVTEYEWDELFRVATVTAPDGGVATFAYDAEDNLTGVTDPIGATTRFLLDEAYQTTGVVDPNGGTWVRENDPTGVLTAMTDPAGAVTAYDLDGVGRVTGVTDPTGVTATVAYDAVGRVTSETDPAGGVTAYAYDALDRVTHVTDAAGYVTEYVYDIDGNLVGVIDRAGNPTLFTVDAAGQVLSVTDATGAEETYVYDRAGRVTAITGPDGNTTFVAYDRAGRAITVTDPLGAVTAYGYDAAGRVTEVTDPLGAVTRYGYDLVGQLVSVTDPLGAVTRYGYDKAGRQISTTDPLGTVTAYAYDRAGQLTQVIEGFIAGAAPGADENVTTAYAYTPAGLLEQITGPAGAVTTFEYDAAGRLRSETGPTGITTNTVYDGAGRVSQVSNGAGLVAGYAYDPRGDVVTLTRADGEVVFEYDAEQRPIAMTDPTGVTGWIYDRVGRTLSQLDSNGNELAYAYTPAGLLESLTYPDGTVTAYEYDAAGRPVSQSTPEGDVGYSWDAAGRLIGIDRPNQVATRFAYDLAGRTTGVVHATPTPEVGTVPEPPAAVPAPPAPPTSEVNGCRDVTDYLAGRTVPTAGEQYECVKAWDYLDRRTLPAPEPAVPAGASLAYAYAYDPAGNVTGTTRTITTPAEDTDADAGVVDVLERVFAYDGLHRLVTSTASTGEVNEYQYDPAGNRTGWTTTTGAGPGSAAVEALFDDAGQLTAITGPEAVSYTYDDAGNRASQTAGGVTMTYTHTPDGRLLDTSTDGRDTAYAYDGLGRQVSVTSADAFGVVTTVQAWDGLTPVFTDSDAHGGTTLVRDPFGDVALQAGAYGSLWPVGDVRNTTGTVNSAGVLTDLTDYADYGQARYESVGWASYAGNDGQPGDPTLGLDHYYARNYDPVAGSWLGPDQWRGLLVAPQTLNRYAYVVNNPVSFGDFLGFRAVIPDLRRRGAPAVKAVSKAVSKPAPPAARPAGPRYAPPRASAPAGPVTLPPSSPAGRWTGPAPKAAVKTPAARSPLTTALRHVNTKTGCAYNDWTCRGNSSGSAAPAVINCATDMKVGMSPQQIAINEACGRAMGDANIRATQPQWVQDLYFGHRSVSEAIRPLVIIGGIAVAGSTAAGSAAGRTGPANAAPAGVARPVGSTLGTVDDVMANPQLLAGKNPAMVEATLRGTPGWQVETLGKGAHAGQGWVLRQYTSQGNPTGLQLRWHPGGGHHGPEPYWRVVGPNGDLGGIIR